MSKKAVFPVSEVKMPFCSGVISAFFRFFSTSMDNCDDDFVVQFEFQTEDLKKTSDRQVLMTSRTILYRFGAFLKRFPDRRDMPPTVTPTGLDPGCGRAGSTSRREP